MTLVSAEELTNYMGQLKLTPPQTAIVESVILPGTQQDLENYLNRPVEPIIVRESLRPDDRGFLWFRHTPIHAIASVTRSDGTVMPLGPAAPAEIDPGELRLLDEWGLPELYGYQLETHLGLYSYWPSITTPMYYTVQYTAGYNGYVNEALKLDIIRVSAREVEMQFDDTLSIRGGTTEAASDSDTRVKGWTADELKKWDRLRRRVAA